MRHHIKALGWRGIVLITLIVAGGISSAQQTGGKSPDYQVAQARVNVDSESRLRMAITYLQSGMPDYQDMEPMLRIAVEQQNMAVKSRLASLGSLQQLEFVGPQAGADVYKATFKNGVTSWIIQISPGGKLAVLYFQ